MKICAISDMHGQYDFNIDPVDILFICGDIIPLYMQRNHEQSFRWLENFFVPWCNKQECKQIYLVAGNHDFALENNDKKINEIFKSTKIIYLNNQGAEYYDKESDKTYTIWGSPMCHIFFNWAFMYDPEYEYSEFSKMTDNCDFVITHDAPYGTSDICLEHWNKEHIGNPELAKVVSEKNPEYLFHGHLHSTNHDCEMLGNTKVYNVSLLNEDYNMKYYPLYLEV